MKKMYIYLILALMAVSCSDNDTFTESEKINENPYKTDIDLSKSYAYNSTNVGVDNEFFMLGYGYDMTGKYAHPEWVRKKIVDTDKFSSEHTSITRGATFESGPGLYVYGDAEKYRKRLASKAGFSDDEIEKYKNLFREVIDSPFENDTTFIDSNYRYAGMSQFHTRYSSYVNAEDITDEYLTDEFKLDVQSKSPEEIIKLYGTHILQGVIVGERVDFLYRSTSMESDLQPRLLYNCRYFSVRPTVWTKEPEYNLTEKENIYFEVIGGEMLTPKGWMVDITNYKGEQIIYTGWNELTDSNLGLVDFRVRTWMPAQTPIYEFVSDIAKKEALRQALEKYLSE